MTSDTDEVLVRRAVGGDEAAFVTLVWRHRDALLALIRRWVPERDAHDDVLQETLLHAWRDLGRLREAGRVRAWLLSIVRNRCRAHSRVMQRREFLVDGQALERSSARCGYDLRSVGSESPVTRSVEGLPPVQKETLQMFYLDGLSVREIARRLQVPEGTVKSRLFHGRCAVRRLARDADKENES